MSVDFRRAEETWAQGCLSCFGGVIIGGGVATIAWSFADTVGVKWIGDVIVVIIFGIACLMPCVSFKLDEEELYLPDCCGLCCGIGSMLTLIIVHLSLRFSIYDDIDNQDSDEHLNEIIFLIMGGVFIMLIEMCLFCYYDYKKQMKENQSYDERVNESDYYQ